MEKDFGQVVVMLRRWNREQMGSWDACLPSLIAKRRLA